MKRYTCIYWSKMKFQSLPALGKHNTLETDTDILNKKIYLVCNYLSGKEIYLKDIATMAANSGMCVKVEFWFKDNVSGV